MLFRSGDIRLLKTDFTIPARSVDMCTLRDVTPTAAAVSYTHLDVYKRQVCNGQDLHLHRVQPHRERAGKELGDDADEPLHAAQNHPMDHDGAVLLACLLYTSRCV